MVNLYKLPSFTFKPADFSSVIGKLGSLTALVGEVSVNESRVAPVKQLPDIRTPGVHYIRLETAYMFSSNRLLIQQQQHGKTDRE